MNNFSYKIFINEKVIHSPVTQNIIKMNNFDTFEIVSENDESDFFSVHNISQGKRVLYFTENKGKFVKKCPGTLNHLCCGYKVINFAFNCPMDCFYCYLQSYQNKPVNMFYVNWNDLKNDFDEFVSEDDSDVLRIGTGEFADSLAFDELTDFSSFLIDVKSNHEKVFLEFKTKIDFSERLMSNSKKKRIILSWSLNPEKIVKKYELKTASLKERLKSMQNAQEKGFLIAFHFDPILYYEEYKKDYKELIKQIFTYIKPRRIAYISLGGFRFDRELKYIVRRRFPGNPFVTQEQLLCDDNKFRYFRSIREELYEIMITSLRSIREDMPLYFCMEKEYMWNHFFKEAPGTTEEVSDLLDSYCLNAEKEKF